jgi:hypothetical protein
MVQTQVLPISDFSGGFTDDYVNAPLNTAQEMDNFLLLENNSIITRPGSIVQDAVNAALIPAGQQRIATFINYNKDDKAFFQSANKLYYRNPLAYTTLQGPTGNDLFSLATVSSHLSFSEWKKQVFVTSDSFETTKKFFKDNTGVMRLRTAGLPNLASAPTVTVGAAGAAQYVYAFHFHSTYFADQEEFQDFGSVTQVLVANSGDPSVNANNISLIPVLANGSTESYDTSNLKIYIFRTLDGGDVFYKIGEVTNGTTTFADTFSDSVIGVNERIYTTGDVLENDAPPLAKYLHIVNNIGYYGFLKEGAQLLKSDLLQSIPEDPDSVPNTNRITVDDEIKGVHSVQSIPMIFCRKHIYRIEGYYDELGRNFPVAIRINDTAGCVSNKSIVQAKDYVFWAGNDKIYGSDGYKVVPLSDHFSDRYKEMIASSSDPENITGTYDEKNERIYWSVQTDSSNPDSDTLWVLDLGVGIKANACFTSWSGGDSFAPSCVGVFADKLVRCDRRGYVFVHDEIYSTDPKINTLAQPATWGRQAITYLYRGFATNFGTDVVRKWVTRFFLTAKNESNVTIQVTAINDDGRLVRPLQAIRYRKNFVWGDPEFVWGDPQFVWNASGLIQESRRFPARGLRCSYLQMEITNAFGVITSSDKLGNVTMLNNTCTLVNSVDADWPENFVDYFIAFETDNFTKEYLITARTADTLTFLDIAGTAPVGTQRWIVRGTRKDEILNLLSYTLSYAPISQSANQFEAGQSGELGG